MLKALLAGVVVGGLLVAIIAREAKSKQKSVNHRRDEMTAEEKIVAHAQALSAERPDTATPNKDFIRDWAYGNAGLEDESITIEQVERVLAKGRTA